GWATGPAVGARGSGPRRLAGLCSGSGSGSRDSATVAGGREPSGGCVPAGGCAPDEDGVAGAGTGSGERAGAGAWADTWSWGGAVLADTVNATSSSVKRPSTHPSKAVIASQDRLTVCKHPHIPC